jgi:hypothetical protein
MGIDQLFLFMVKQLPGGQLSPAIRQILDIQRSIVDGLVSVPQVFWIR